MCSIDLYREMKNYCLKTGKPQITRAKFNLNLFLAKFGSVSTLYVYLKVLPTKKFTTKFGTLAFDQAVYLWTDVIITQEQVTSFPSDKYVTDAIINISWPITYFTSQRDIEEFDLISNDHLGEDLRNRLHICVYGC